MSLLDKRPIGHRQARVIELLRREGPTLDAAIHARLATHIKTIGDVRSVLASLVARSLVRRQVLRIGSEPLEVYSMEGGR